MPERTSRVSVMRLPKEFVPVTLSARAGAEKAGVSARSLCGDRGGRGACRRRPVLGEGDRRRRGAPIASGGKRREPRASAHKPRLRGRPPPPVASMGPLSSTFQGDVFFVHCHSPLFTCNRQRLISARPAKGGGVTCGRGWCLRMVAQGRCGGATEARGRSGYFGEPNRPMPLYGPLAGSAAVTIRSRNGQRDPSGRRKARGSREPPPA